jgi:phosphoesterase RecJ-like protein
MEATPTGYEPSLAEAAALIRASGDVWLIPHESPDGDTFGCSLALYLALTRMGKRATVFISEAPPRPYAFLAGAREAVVTDRLPESPPDLVIIPDNGQFQRAGNGFAQELTALGIGPDAPSGNRTADLINIDHHSSNTMYGDVNVIDLSAAAVGEMIYDLLTLLGAQITKDIAECIYVTLITDTGKFSYSNTTPRTLAIAGKLVELGVKTEYINERVYNVRTASQMKLFGRVFSTLVADPDAGVVYCYQTREMLAETGATMADTDGVADLLKTIGEYPVSFFFKEEGPESVKVSVRSKNEFDANGFCQKFGGGGHKAASGCRISKPLAEAIDLVIGEYRRIRS